jgi:hypothetical protein
VKGGLQVCVSETASNIAEPAITQLVPRDPTVGFKGNYVEEMALVQLHLTEDVV